MTECADPPSTPSGAVQGIVTSEPAPGVLLLELARPQARNALNEAMFVGLADAWQRLATEDRLRAAVVVGRGSAFCAGADLKSPSPQSIADSVGDTVVQKALLQAELPDKPIVAAVNGHCIGGGLLLALGCDIRIGNPEASFGLPALRLGYHPRAAVPLVVSVCGPSRAASMILGGRTLGAAEGLAAGLLSEVVPSETLLNRAIDQATAMAAANRSTLHSLLAVLRAARASSAAVDALDARAADQSAQSQRS